MQRHGSQGSVSSDESKSDNFINSDEDTSSIYFQDDNANIVEWLKNDDVTLTNQSISIDENTIATSHAIVRNNNTENYNTNNNGNNDDKITNLSYITNKVKNNVNTNTDAAIDIVTNNNVFLEEHNILPTARPLKNIEDLTATHQSDSLSIDELQLWIKASKNTINHAMQEERISSMIFNKVTQNLKQC